MSLLFPAKEVKHEMYSRHKVKFVENLAKSVRYKNSSVPHMQHLLNEDILHEEFFLKCCQKTNLNLQIIVLFVLSRVLHQS